MNGMRGLLLGLGCCWYALLSAQPDSIKRPIDIHSSEDMNQLRRAQLNPHALVYEKALQLKDWPTAIAAIHHLLLQDPDNVYLQDSLAGLYHRVGNAEACLTWCNEKLQRRPDDLFLLQLAGNADEANGNLKSALERFERIFELNHGHFYRYKVAGLQFQLGRYGECGSHVESMLSDPGIDAEVVRMDWGNGGGEVALRSAVLNLRGNLELMLGKENLARKSFREALKLSPDFILARNNLDALQAKYNDRREESGQ